MKFINPGYGKKESSASVQEAPARYGGQKPKSTSPLILTSDKKTYWNLKLLMSLDWKVFEELTGEVFKGLGYRIELTPFGADDGIDLLLYEEEEMEPYAAVQCKSWTNRVIGVKEIRELLGAMVHRKLNHGVFVTTNNFSNEARSFAFGKTIELVDGPAFLENILKVEQAVEVDLLTKIKNKDCFIPTCPTCGTKMVLRTAKKGTRAGNQFYGCRNYPRCRRTYPIPKEPKVEKIMSAEKTWVNPCT